MNFRLVEMKIYLFFLFLMVYHVSSAQEFTTEQIEIANTAKSISYLTEIEKDAILYLNLARLFPQLFVSVVLENYKGPDNFSKIERNNSYYLSLKNKLSKLKSCEALQFEAKLYENAKCFAKETGDKGGEGHQRKICPKENFAECVSYGMVSGKDIAMQWLLDDGVPSLGHRAIVLDSTYHKIGLSVHPHKKWETCAVAEIIW